MLRKFYILIVFSLVMSCDISKEDYIGVPGNEDENPANTFYTVPQADLTIDPTAFARLKNVSSLTISQMPKHGEARFIENGFVFYHSTNAQVASDVFLVEGKTSGGVSVNEEVKINFVANPADLPCYAGTLGDKAKTEPEKAIEINVLANDKTCSSIENNSLKIEIPPKHGKAEIVNQKVVYTANKDFLGDDIFFYRVGINTKKNPVASVEVTIAESTECAVGIVDDIINILSYTPNTDLQLDVLQNDKICALYEKAELKIVKNPAIGTLRVDKTIANRPVLIYKIDSAIKGEQTFEYALYRSESLFLKAKVVVNFN